MSIPTNENKKGEDKTRPIRLYLVIAYLNFATAAAAFSTADLNQST